MQSALYNMVFTTAKQRMREKHKYINCKKVYHF
jgi:hypothetical protein